MGFSLSKPKCDGGWQTTWLPNVYRAGLIDGDTVECWTSDPHGKGWHCELRWATVSSDGWERTKGRPWDKHGLPSSIETRNCERRSQVSMVETLGSQSQRTIVHPRGEKHVEPLIMRRFVNRSSINRPMLTAHTLSSDSCDTTMPMPVSLPSRGRDTRRQDCSVTDAAVEPWIVRLWTHLQPRHAAVWNPGAGTSCLVFKSGNAASFLGLASHVAELS